MMNDGAQCPLCIEGHLTPRTEQADTEYRGVHGRTVFSFAECNVCGSEITGDADSRANKRAVLAFRKSVEGMLSGQEIRAIREKYGITQDQAARLFGGGPKAFSKYEADDVMQSESMDNQLRLVKINAGTFWDLVTMKGMMEEFPQRALLTTVFTRDNTFECTVMESESLPPANQRPSVSYLGQIPQISVTLH